MDTHSFAFHPLHFKTAESKMLQPQEQHSPRVGGKIPGKRDATQESLRCYNYALSVVRFGLFWDNK